MHCGNMGADMDIALWIRVSMGWKETASRVNNLRWLAPVKTVHTGPAVVVVVSSKWTATQHYPPQPQLCTLSPSKNVSQHPELRSHPGTSLASVLSVVWGQPRAPLAPSPASSPQSYFFLLKPFRTVSLLLALYLLSCLRCAFCLMVK